MRLRQRQPPGRWKRLLPRSRERAWSGTPTHQSSVLQFKGLPVLGEASLEYGVDGFSLIRRALFCQLLPADVSECHGGPERGASAGIAAAEDGSGVVADGEQAGDWLLSTSRAGFSWPSRLFSGRAARDRAMGIAFAPPVLRATGCPLTRKDRGLTPAVARRACMRAFSGCGAIFDRGMGKQALNGCSGGG